MRPAGFRYVRKRIHLGSEDKVTLLLAYPLGDLMVLGRAGLDICKTISKDLFGDLIRKRLRRTRYVSDLNWWTLSSCPWCTAQRTSACVLSFKGNGFVVGACLGPSMDTFTVGWGGGGEDAHTDESLTVYIHMSCVATLATVHTFTVAHVRK